MLCCLLGLIWVANPNFHSISHIVDLQHRHPTDSVYRHSQTADSISLSDLEHQGLASDSSPFNGQPSTDGFAGTNPVSGEGVQSDFVSESDPDSPAREPDDSDAPFFYLHLIEKEAVCSLQYEVDLVQAMPVLDKPNFECKSFFSSAESSTIGARGPPSLLSNRFSKLI